MPALTRYRLLSRAGAALVTTVVAVALFAGLHATDAQTAAPTTSAPSGSSIVATVDGDPITEDDVNLADAEFSSQLANVSADQRRNLVIDLLIRIRLLAKEAVKEGIDVEPAVAEQLKIVHDRALYNEYLDRLFAKEVTQDAAHKLFDQEQATAVAQYEYHVAHILVPTEAEAKDLIAQLDAGGDFAKMAADKSIDTGSAANGGDLGFIAAGDTVAPFEMAAFALDVGKYTEAPVQSQFGFHVIKLEEKRLAAPKTFESEAQRLQQELAQNAFQKEIDDLTARSKIVRAPAPGQQPAPPTPSTPLK